MQHLSIETVGSFESRTFIRQRFEVLSLGGNSRRINQLTFILDSIGQEVRIVHFDRPHQVVHIELKILSCHKQPLAQWTFL